MFTAKIIKRLPNPINMWVITVCIMVMLSIPACHSAPLIVDLVIEPAEVIIGAVQGDTRITFVLNQPASIEIVIKNTSGNVFLLRQRDLEKKYPAGQHSLLFSGLVQGYVLPGEKLPFQVVQRLIPDGEYTLIISADSGFEVGEITGSVAVHHSIEKLPSISDFSITPGIISPNRDGIHDAATITLLLPQDVKQLTVYAVSPEGNAYPIPEGQGAASPNTAGEHIFRFDALEIVGDQLQNGHFAVTADAYDAYEQHIRWQQPLEVRAVGDVTGYILNGAVTYTGNIVELNETLCFTLTVLNNGDGYMRTIGPWPATLYQDTMNFTSKHYPEDKGVFRVGLDFESSDGQYPFRWAIGTPEADLVQLEDGWYLPPQHTGTVTGCVQFSEIPKINPQYAWVGLIHELSDPQLMNHRVAPYLVEVHADAN